MTKICLYCNHEHYYSYCNCGCRYNICSHCLIYYNNILFCGYCYECVNIKYRIPGHINVGLYNWCYLCGIGQSILHHCNIPMKNKYMNINIK